MPEAAFGIKITADSEVGEAFAKIKSGLADLEKVVKKTDAGTKDAAKRTGMLGRELQRAGKFGKELGRDFREIGRATRDSVGRLGDILPPLAALTGAGSIAGLGALADSFARFGGGVQRGAAALGISTDAFQQYTSAAEYAGVSSDAMGGAMATLNARIHDAAYGLGGSGGVIWASKRFGIALRNGDGSVRSSTAILGDLADVIHGLADPDDQRRVAEMFGAGGMLNFLRAGRSGIERYLAMTRTLSTEQLRRGRELELSWVGLAQSAKIAGYSIAADLEPHLAPLLDKMATWLRSPGNQKWLGDEIEGFFKWLENIKFDRIDGFIDKVDKLLDRLGFGSGGSSGSNASGGGIGGNDLLSGAGIAAAIGATKPGRAVIKTIATASRGIAGLILPALLSEPGILSKLGLAGVLAGLAVGANPSGETSIFGVPQKALAVPRRRGSSAAVPGFWSSIGGGLDHAWGAISNALLPAAHAAPMAFPAAANIPAAGRALLRAIAGGEATRYDELYGGGSFSGFGSFPRWSGLMGPAGRSHAAGLYQFEPATWREEAHRLGLTDFAPGSQDRGAWDLAQRQYRRRTGRDLLADLNAGHTQDIGSVLHSTWTSAGGAAFGRRLSAAIAGAAGGAPAAAADGDTRHQVEININGAPAGTRAQISAATGPAQVSLRLGYAMNGLVA